jgi:hypothetical protein
MNRAERRKMMKTIPGYKSAVTTAAKEAMDGLEKVFMQRWADDETLNDGKGDYEDDFSDEIYND